MFGIKAPHPWGHGTGLSWQWCKTWASFSAAVRPLRACGGQAVEVGTSRAGTAPSVVVRVFVLRPRISGEGGTARSCPFSHLDLLGQCLTYIHLFFSVRDVTGQNCWLVASLIFLAYCVGWEDGSECSIRAGANRQRVIAGGLIPDSQPNRPIDTSAANRHTYAVWLRVRNICGPARVLF